MSVIDNFWIRITSKYVGSDENGNCYYESHAVDYLGRKRRYIVYTKHSEPSTISSLWHGWLHHMTDAIPDDARIAIWHKNRVPNHTGTKAAYSPIDCGHRTHVSADYQQWKPKD